MPYLRELDDRDSTPQERTFLEQEERRLGRPLAEWKKRLWVAQVRMIGELACSTVCRAASSLPER